MNRSNRAPVTAKTNLGKLGQEEMKQLESSQGDMSFQGGSAKKITIPMTFSDNASSFQNTPHKGKIKIDMKFTLDTSAPQMAKQPPKKKPKPKPKSSGVQVPVPTYGDDDFDFYRPKNKTNRRRLPTCLNMLNNDIFANVVDKCIIFDKTKLFHYPDKKKDAPNYTDFVQNPIDLTTIKNKCKRSEYENEGMFMADITLLKRNAETYNGTENQIANLAR